MLLSALFVYFRDIQPIWEVVNQVIFYASPIIIPVDTVKQNLSPALFHLYMLNPLAVILQQFRHAFITHATPSAGAAAGLRPGDLLVTMAIVAGRSSCSGSASSTGRRHTSPRTSKPADHGPERWAAAAWWRSSRTTRRRRCG